MVRLTTALVASWLADYKARNSELLEGDPEYRRWLEEEYVPIAGGWQY